MSTEHQNYSIEGQSVANAAYALEHDLELVRTYIDAGISGVRLDKRQGLKQLLADVLGGRAEYSVILVYDVSRWGRFQDPDESAHYEFLCRAAGVPIVYTSEPFASDGSITATLVKQLKRAMAAEYSRELSDKVSRAKRGLAQRGYYCGGVCSYGFRRQVVAPDGSLGPLLGHGERKALLGHRVVLAAGPDAEIQAVRRIFRQFAFHGLSTTAIAQRLNDDGIASNQGLPWSRNRVYRVLTDEKYIGTVVAGRRKSYLAVGRKEPRESWLRMPGACPSLIARDLFDLVQSNIRRSEQNAPDDALIAELRQILVAQGRLSASLIRAEGNHLPALYARRFGSLGAAYALVGYRPDNRQVSAAARHRPATRGVHPFGLSDAALLVVLKQVYAQHGQLTVRLIDAHPDLPSSTTCCQRLGGMLHLCELVGCKPRRRQVDSAAAAARRRTLGSNCTSEADRRQ
jgi:DNA invertase Pin-like site-specific DNA recombinase